MVEMALVLPILIWLIVGMVDIARMTNAYLTIQHASREAVRLAITGATDTAVGQRAMAASAGLEPARVTVTITPTGSRASGADISVAVSYRYKVMALMGVVGSEVPLETSLTARVE